jgi:hypothetical protein
MPATPRDHHDLAWPDASSAARGARDRNGAITFTAMICCQAAGDGVEVRCGTNTVVPAL